MLYNQGILSDSAVLDEDIINALAYGTVDNEPGSVAKLQQVADFFKTWHQRFPNS